MLKLCQLDRDLRLLRSRQLAVTSAPIRDRSSARRLLLEELVTSEGAVTCCVGDESWTARRRPARLVERADAEVPVRAQRLWLAEADELRAALLDSPSPSLGEALAEYLVPRSLPPSDQPAAAPSWTLVIRRGGSRSAEKPGEEPQERQRLLQVIVESNRQLAKIGKDFAEARREIQEGRAEVEKELLPELSGGALRIVSLQDPATGECERYYVRVKPARRPAPLQLTGSMYRRLLRRLVDEELRSSGLSGARAVEHLCSYETGRSICEHLKQIVDMAVESKKAPLPMRISLDHVRSDASGRSAQG